jgi:uncharacterized cupredoxin-like copper-binding protein
VDAEVQLNRNRVRRTGVMTAVASFALVALTACGGGAGEEAHEDVTRVPIASDAAAQATREAASAPAATPGAEGGTPGAGATPATEDETTTAATAIDVVSYDIYFEPSEVTIPANTDVTVNLPNDGVTPHNFSIDALGIDVDIAPGATEQVVINAPAGEYEYYCNVPGHKQAGMVGTLIVSEDAAAAPAEAATPAGAPAETPQGTATEQGAAATPAEPAAASPAAVAADAVQTVNIVAYDIYFEPKEVTISANTDVTVMITNDGVAPHNFSIDELGIDIDIPAGETQETVLNAPAGEYEYYCNVPGHKEAGMVGTLIVSEDAGAAPADTAAAEQVAPATPDVATPAGSTTESTPAGEEEQAAARAEAGAGEAMAVESYDIYFEPDELSIPADTDVPVSLPNEGVTPHNFSIDELGIDVDIAPGATEETVINAPAGTYEYYCNVPGHKQAGMVGTLTVG